MYQYRVTKYNPKYRDNMGRYIMDDWTSIGDIGDRFRGVTLTKEIYEQMELTYINAIINFLKESKVYQLRISNLENHNCLPLKIKNNDLVDLEKIKSIAINILRGKFWCKLVGENAFVHFGFDYYLYIGTPFVPTTSITIATENGLFVEEMDSPYLHLDADEDEDEDEDAD